MTAKEEKAANRPLEDRLAAALKAGDPIKLNPLGRDLTAAEKLAEASRTALDGMTTRPIGLQFEVNEKGTARKSAAVMLPALQLSQIVESPFNTRKRFLKIDELAESIRQVGILQPLTVRQVDEKGRTSFELVFGHRRLRAAKLAGLATVPCEVRDFTDAQACEVQVVENVQRDELTLLEEADACAQLMKVAGYTADQVAERVGQSRAWVYGRVKLGNLGPEARKAFNEGRLDKSVALALARVPQGLQAKAVANVAPKGPYEPPTARRAIEMIQREFCRQLRHAPFDLKDEMLVTAAGSCSKCPKNSRTTPELFGDFDRESAGGLTGVCSDTLCYAKKVEAHAAVQTSALLKAGAKEVPQKDAPQFSSDGSLGYASSWVKVDGPAGDDAKKRTWRQLLARLPEDKRPQIYAARAGENGVVQIFKRDQAVAAAAELGHAFAKVEAKQEEQESKERKKHAKQRTEKKTRLEVVTEIGERIAAQVEAKGPTVREFRWALRAYLSSRNIERVLARRELSEPQLDQLIDTKGDASELAGLLMECVADELGANCHDDFPEDLRDMAANYQLDVDRMEQLRDQRKADKRVAREEKKKGAA